MFVFSVKFPQSVGIRYISVLVPSMARMSAIAVGFVLLLSMFEGGYSLQADENLSCIQDVKRFSTGDSPRHYYECKYFNIFTDITKYV